jgi:hypothetical protein
VCVPSRRRVLQRQPFGWGWKPKCKTVKSESSSVSPTIPHACTALALSLSLPWTNDAADPAAASIPIRGLLLLQSFRFESDPQRRGDPAIIRDGGAEIRWKTVGGAMTFTVCALKRLNWIILVFQLNWNCRSLFYSFFMKHCTNHEKEWLDHRLVTQTQEIGCQARSQGFSLVLLVLCSI